MERFAWGCLQEWRKDAMRDVAKAVTDGLGIRVYTEDVIATTNAGSCNVVKYAPQKEVFKHLAAELLETKKQNLGPSIDKDFKTFVYPIEKAKRPSIEDLPDDKPQRVTLARPPPCWKALVCLCSERGQLIHRLWLRFFR